ncbi:MAG: enoyl-CoA hydratase-related protein [Candidatus Nanopelagicales bacterium]|nr:enoyl-CoA hydratase-related protein [Candidatus Nanopelagicales bacterium]
MTSTERELLIDNVNGVRVLSLNRPERLNAFTAQAYFGLAAALEEAAVDDTVEVVLLKGEGRAYCAGVDLFALGETDSGEFSRGIKTVVLALANFPKPIVAAVHGAIVGFGATMLLHVDIVLTADDARWRFPFTELGTGPEAGSSYMLPKIVGERRAAELLMTSRWVSGQEAAELGLATDAVPADQVHQMGLLVAQKLTSLKGAALVETKALMRLGWAQEIAGAIDRETKTAGEIGRKLGGGGFAWGAR